ncbi:MAG: cupin domain-containing protein, partial [Myxococcota bacterium]
MSKNRHLESEKASQGEAGANPSPRGNLLRGLPPSSSEETFENLFERPGLRVERIVSHGQITPPGQWYDQEQDEWVMVVSGAARLRIGGYDELDMTAGDWILLPAHCRHRVEWTDPAHPTVWLAVHFRT